MRQKLDYLQQVQRGLDFIEAHLDENLSLSQVSVCAGISHWHFQRIFKALTGETLKSYVRSRRLAVSSKTLLLTNKRILDVAIEAGFESQAAYTRAFKTSFGMTPGAYRKRNDASLVLSKVQLNGDYLRHINQNLSLRPKIVDKPTMFFVGLHTTYFGSDSEKNNMAEKLPKLWDDFLERLHEVPERRDALGYGIIRTSGEGSERLHYLAGVETSADTRLPEGMKKVEIAAARYAEFEHRGKAEALDHTVNYIYSTWLAQSGMRHSYAPDLEIYGDDYHPTSEDSIVRYAIPLA